MRVLGVDPGLTRCGLGVVESGRGRQIALVAVGVARTPARMDLDQRLLRLATALVEWIDAYQPGVVAIERVFAQHNVMTVTGTAQVAGIAMLEAARREIPVAMHTPTEVKAAVTGNGAAGKPQIQHMVARLLDLDDPPKPADAADALAIAICEAWRPTMSAAVGGSVRLTPAQRHWAEAERLARRPAASGR